MKFLFRVSEFTSIKPVEYEVLSDTTSINTRNLELRKGEVYAKFNVMTRLLVMTKDGEVLIRSLIFELTDKTVRIKGRISIPINSIKEITYEF